MPETYVMRNGDKQQRHERVDICVVAKTGPNKVIELVECKLAEFEGPAKVTLKRIESSLKKAFDQLKTITGIHHHEVVALRDCILKNVGVVIGLPWVPPSPSAVDDVGNLVSDLKSCKFGAVAWCFPADYCGVESGRYKSRCYPGTFLVVDELQVI